MSDSEKLGRFLREVSNWNWEEFCLAENDSKYTSNEAMIFAVIRACAMEKLDAIKLALNRIDGKLATPVKVEYPKMFYRYPNATLPKGTTSSVVAQLPELPDVASESKEVLTGELVHKPVEDGEKSEESDLPSLSLRQTLVKMADHPRQVPDAIIQFATATQQWLKGNAAEPEEKPLVKSVVAAHLLKLAQERNVDALTEVFDQIDGKLVETLKVLGDDIIITDYSLTAPEGAYLNDQGVVEIEATQTQDLWAKKLGKQD